MDWSDAAVAVIVAITSIVSTALERNARQSEAREARAAELKRESSQRKRGLFVDWLRITAGFGEFAMKYIQHGGADEIRREYVDRMNAVLVQIEIESPGIYEQMQRHAIALGGALKPAFDEAMKPSPPGSDPSMRFEDELRKRTQAERKDVVKAMRGELDTNG